ncbi:cbb3-type cytochrome c oxidase subunit I [Paucibacter sp. R3-3]|uniref:Cbb3-type cytochrome c oxidase subunit I n=1 Tax=Roseateles agri TaxID=3098619 RepID=A0ABU5DMR9_9BURK|nr:cbb3-type cytochrome c oxidase subunit I [Paucibacter sp. R3-3]MDY0747583.1 cbb3-type cytochrome c oxidase subunit I [Paucibacter sp. R3-3]
MTTPTPNPLPRPPGEEDALIRAWAAPRGWRAVGGVNNVFIGKLYMGTALLFLLLAGVLGLLIRAQLAAPGMTLLDSETYNQVFTMHGTVMMFLFAVPMVEAVSVYLLPNMLGARDLPFPRLSAYAFWAYAAGGLAFFCTLFFGLAPDGGWFLYPPLSGRVYSPGLNADFWLLGIGFIEISAIAGAVELIIGILMTRAPGMSLARMPVYAWSMLIVGLMIVFAFPAVIAGTGLLELERAFDWPIFDPTRGGDPLLWQHLFWFFGHPEVYVIFLPAAGLVSMMVPTLARIPLIGRRAIVASLSAVALLSFALWAHHMFTAGLGSLEMSLVSAASLAVALPGCVQVFCWIGTLWRGTASTRGTTTMLFLLGFLCSFIIGGLTGIMLAVLPFDWQAHDSHFVVAHLHYVLIGGVLFPIFAAIYHWLPLLNGHRLDERCGRWVFGLVFAGFNLAFLPMHWTGLRGMPRRVYTYEAGIGLEVPNLLSSVGAAVLAGGVLLLAFDVLRTLRRPTQAHCDPWSAPTLEWVPAQLHGTRSIPQVSSPDPLWHQPGLAREIEAGEHWLPGTITGGRETLITSPRKARPLHLLVLPGDSLLPLVAGLGTAGFFLLLTIKWSITAWACGLAAVGAILVWLWQTDRSPPRPDATVADGVVLPIGASRWWTSHSWQGTLILIVVDLSILASLAFAHIHLSMRLDVCPPAGAALPAPTAMFIAAAALLTSTALLWWPRAPCASCSLTAGAVALASFATLMNAHVDAGLMPEAQAWSASLAALLAYQGLHALLQVVMSIYLAMRTMAGLVTSRQRATLDNIRLLWLGCCAQGVAVIALPYAL